MKATDILRGEETGGSTVNSPTDAQYGMIEDIEKYHPRKPKFLGCTSKDAYTFVGKYYPLAKVLKEEAIAKFNQEGANERPSDKLAKVGEQTSLNL